MDFKILFNTFSKHNKNLYYVGGSVRDMVLEREPKDYDFTTDALPEETKAILKSANFNPWDLGEKFGTIAVNIGAKQIEITTHRKDLTPGRHPDVMFTKNLKEDLARRDFTVNSMAMDKDKNIIDPFGGARDIERRIIRTTGLPASRFSEDPLRMLRAIRFVSQLGFSINKHTKDVINTFSHAIISVSKERWFEEINKLLLGQHVERALELLYQSRLFGYILPEVFPLTMLSQGKLPSKDLWIHTKKVVEATPQTIDVRWAALLHDIAKPQTRFENHKEVHFFQHEYLGSEIAYYVCRRMKMSKKMTRSIVGLVALHHRIGDVVSNKCNPPVSKNALRRVIRDCEDRGCSINDLIEIFSADCTSSKKATKDRQKAHAELLKEALKNIRKEDLKPKLPVGIGKKIMERYNIKPGPAIGKIKDFLDQKLLDGVISSDDPVDKMFLIVDDRIQVLLKDLNKTTLPENPEELLSIVEKSLS